MTEAAILDLCAAGAISPQIALARLLLTGRAPDPAALRDTAAARPDAAALGEVARLAEQHRDRLGPLSRLAALDLLPDSDVVTRTAALFDRLAADAPEAGVAIYSFGDPDALAGATAELLAVIRDWTPVAGRQVLDFGCGIGRVAIALADEGAAVLGIDLSAGMIEQARTRAGERPRLSFCQSDGATIPADNGSIDLLLAADSLPYVVQAGDLDRFAAEAARVLRPGGALQVFNWSYRGDLARDIADAHAIAATHGFDVVRAGEHPFAIWDASGFHLVRR
jgi:SAM-dependent methyltransferase